jgi:predicted nucleic acid-binding protein
MYLDTAIIVKLLVNEADSAWFNRALSGNSFETSELALAEVSSALLSKERNGQITPAARMAATEQFSKMIGSELLKLHALNRAVLDRAVAIQAACHPKIPLRTLDALHVATCELHRGEKLATTDGRMRAACRHFAITLLPENIEDISIAN